MFQPSIRDSIRRVVRGPLVALLLGATYFAALSSKSGPRAAYEYDRDEGFSLMKALLVNRGHSLYGEIWSDQPPGYTYLLAWLTRLLRETPESARLLTIFLASALVAGIYEIARREDASYRGHIAGLTAALSLIMSVSFVRYSVPVMVTLPSVAFVVLAWVALKGAEPSRLRVLLASLLFGVGLSVKLIIAPVAPAFLLLLGPFRSVLRKPRLRLPLRNGLTFGLGCLVAILVCFGPFLFEPGIRSLYDTHADGMAVMTYSSVWNFYREDASLFVLALFGAAVGLKRSRDARFACAWIALATLALARHNPVWHHHRFLVTVPGAVLVGVFVRETLRLASGHPRLHRRLFASACLVVATFGLGSSVVGGRLGPLVSALQSRPTGGKFVAAEVAIREHTKGAKLAVTPNQFMAYRLGLPVPPNLAVTSTKRRQTGNLTNDEIRATIRKTQPDVLIFSNRWDQALRKKILTQALEPGYREIYSNPSARELAVYVRALPQEQSEHRSRRKARKPKR